MFRRKYDLWKAAIVVGGVLLFLVLMTLVSVSSADAHEGISVAATLATVTVQATPTVDATMTALNKEKLQLDITQEKQAIAQQQHTLSNFIWAGGAALFSAYAGFTIAVLSYMYNARKDRQDR